MAVWTRYIYQNHHHKHVISLLEAKNYYQTGSKLEVAEHVRRSVKYSTLTVNIVQIIIAWAYAQGELIDIWPKKIE